MAIKSDTKFDVGRELTARFIVHRPGANPVTITGPDSCDVRDGALLLFHRDSSGNETVRFVFGPGEWSTVNIAPV